VEFWKLNNHVGTDTAGTPEFSGSKAEGKGNDEEGFSCS
jgi:hypothetical protein